MNLIVGMTGASGVVYGIRLLEIASGLADVETHLVVSRAARQTIASESGKKYEEICALADFTYQPEDVGAQIASGSFATSGMIVIPCSGKTLSAIALGLCGDLISRAAIVTLKEGRPLVLVVRETPLYLGHLRRMVEADEAGAIIFPPVPAFYTMPRSLEYIVDQTAGRVLARAGFSNGAYQVWKGG